MSPSRAADADRSRRRRDPPRRLAAFALAVVAAACRAPEPTPGMTAFQARPHARDAELEEVARVAPAAGARALLVVYPRTACSASARTVFMDEGGAFLGAVGPGEAALLSVPARAAKILAASSVDVTAHVGAWFYVDEIELPPAPSGVLLETARRDARQCASGNYTNVSVATKPELEATLADAHVRWLTPDAPAGQAWLDAHRARVDELVGRRIVRRPPVVTRTHVP